MYAFHPASKRRLFLFTDHVFRVKNRSGLGWPVYLYHHFVAHINTSRAVNTFHLGALPDINPRRANINT